MADYKVTDTQLSSIASAIRTKGGTSSGLSFPTGFVSAIEAISTGGGGGATDGDVIFIDYDGTIVDAKTKVQINAMTSDSDLPTNPTHTGLTAQGWNWTVVQLKTQLAAMPDQKIYVGQMYITASGATEIDVVMPEGRLDPSLTICVKGTISVDWGDNTTPDSVTGSSLSTRLAVLHTYASAGKYTIKISKTSGDGYKFYGSSKYSLLLKNTNSNENKVYVNCVKNVRIGNGMTNIGISAFYNCYSLASITIPSSVTAIDSSAFYYCYSLTSIIIPRSVTSIGSSAFSVCYSLARIVTPGGMTSIATGLFNNCYTITDVLIPSSVTSIGDSAFSSCYSIANVTIPSSVTSIGNNAFSGCYSIAIVTIPSSVTSIGDSAFANCYGVAEYHIKPSSPPTLGATVFNNIVSDCIIYVPNGKLDDYQGATDWSDYASYMQEEPS